MYVTSRASIDAAIRGGVTELSERHTFTATGLVREPLRPMRRDIQTTRAVRVWL